MKVLFEPAEGKLLGAQVLGWDGVRQTHRRPRRRLARWDDRL